ncbi:uncharacterized protein BCR38DRAFT_419557 [Pseudomassariella vexata]|uniref:Monooxygenase n=1 Tax=Pseudomassariella vexata TaxID=1141098 RepID=A0A1Y2EEB8_9PEZI|nr:uncharacterized protein BCR38DRAFT_419557 [Pseudomassariella vexata]ORY69606.1 hypothetical protein BCR38DRAFT_419557 [Pseudomassariella vexata]
MGAYNFSLLKDELSLPAWLLIGAAAQTFAGWIAPPGYALVPVAVASSVLILNFAAQALGILRYSYLKGATLDRISVTFPEDDGSRPEKMGTKPVAVFMLGIRSNHPLGRLHPGYQKINDYLDEMYADAEANRATNGYLGRTPHLISTNFSENNTLHSMSYWKTIDHLEAFSRRPIHIKGFKFLVSSVMGDRPHDLGVLHEVLYCPPGHWEAIYTNMKPQGFADLKWSMAGGKNFRGPYIERDPVVINGMWGRMGNKLRQDEVEKKMAEVTGPAPV